MPGHLNTYQEVFLCLDTICRHKGKGAQVALEVLFNGCPFLPTSLQCTLACVQCVGSANCTYGMEHFCSELQKSCMWHLPLVSACPTGNATCKRQVNLSFLVRWNPFQGADDSQAFQLLPQSLRLAEAVARGLAQGSLVEAMISNNLVRGLQSNTHHIRRAYAESHVTEAKRVERKTTVQ